MLEKDVIWILEDIILSFNKVLYFFEDIYSINIHGGHDAADL